MNAVSSIGKGIGGGLGSFLAIATAHQQTIAWALGCVVAIASFTSLAFDIRKKWRDRNK